MSIYFLYKTIHLETGEYYIGIHGIDTKKYPDFNDGYLGSGDRIIASVKKYGRKAFKRSILAINESLDVVLALEAAMVTVEMIADPLCLNIAPGGRGGGSRKGKPSPLKGVPKSAATCQKMSVAHKGVSLSVIRRQRIGDSHRGVPNSVEHRLAISAAMKGKPSPKKGVPTGPHSAEHNRKNSEAVKAAWARRKAAKLLAESSLPNP